MLLSFLTALLSPSEPRNSPPPPTENALGQHALTLAPPPQLLSAGILFEETLVEVGADGKTPLVKHLEEQGIIPGIVYGAAPSFTTQCALYGSPCLFPIAES